MAGFSRPLAPTRSSFIECSYRVIRRPSGSAPRNRGRLWVEWFGLACRGASERQTGVALGAPLGGTDDALLEQDVAVKAAFAGLDDEGLRRALIEGEALEEGKLHRGLVLFDELVEVLVGLLAFPGVVDDLHGE